MAKRETSSSKNVPSFKPAKGKSSWLWALVAVVLATLLLVAFFDYAPNQSINNTTNPTAQNLVGRFGAEVSWYGFYLFGGAAWLFPVCLALLGIMLVRPWIPEIRKNPIAHVFGDKPATSLDHLRATAVIRPDDRPQILGIHAR